MLKFRLTQKSKLKLDKVTEEMGDITVPLQKFAFNMYQRAERESYMPERTGNLKHNKLINRIGRNKVRITQLQPYANRRYYENNLHPNQTEWFDKYYEQNKMELDLFLMREIVKEIE